MNMKNLVNALKKKQFYHKNATKFSKVRVRYLSCLNAVKDSLRFFVKRTFVKIQDLSLKKKNTLPVFEALYVVP